LQSRQNRSSWGQIKIALQVFGDNLAEGIAGVITFVAFFLPWLILITLMIWAVVALWKKARRKQTCSEAP